LTDYGVFLCGLGVVGSHSDLFLEYGEPIVFASRSGVSFSRLNLFGLGMVSSLVDRGSICGGIQVSVEINVFSCLFELSHGKRK